MFVTNWISPTKIQKISEITNFFRHYFLSRTEVYLDENYKARYSFCDFIKRERFYIYLFLGMAFVIILGMTVYIMAMREQVSFGG